MYAIINNGLVLEVSNDKVELEKRVNKTGVGAVFDLPAMSTRSVSTNKKKPTRSGDNKAYRAELHREKSGTNHHSRYLVQQKIDEISKRH